MCVCGWEQRGFACAYACDVPAPVCARACVLLHAFFERKAAKGQKSEAPAMRRQPKRSEPHQILQFVFALELTQRVFCGHRSAASKFEKKDTMRSAGHAQAMPGTWTATKWRTSSVLPLVRQEAFGACGA